MATGLTSALPVAAADETNPVVVAGSTWRHHDGGTDLGTAWRCARIADTSWKQGPTEIGYGDGDEATKVTANRSTYYLRRSFTVADASKVTALQLRAVVDDGAVVYLNGTEIWRTNVAAGQTYATLATT